jgi:hypothetical protein
VVAVAVPDAAAEASRVLIEALADLAFSYLCQLYKDNKLPEVIC